MKKIVVLIVLIQLSYNAFSQTCDCSSNLQWLIETFEKNDAGFKYVIDKKGANVYAAHNKHYTEKAQNIAGLKECHQLLNDWTEFFRKNHLNVQLVAGTEHTNGQGRPSEKDLIEKYSHTETYAIDRYEFDAYISTLDDKTGFEGVWTSDPYTIGIIKDITNPDRAYVGFILESQSPYWQKNQVKLEIFKSEDGQYSMTYYMRDHSAEKFDNIEFYGGSYLVADFIFLKRVLPKVTIEKNIERYFNAMFTDKPYIERIADNTLLLRISSFRHSNKKYIDSVLAANDDLIRNTENLIIDLRYNGGGSDASYDKIIPYLYTNPIRGVGVAYLSTELNNQRMIDFMNNPDWSEDDKKWAKKSLEKLNKHIGEFVNLNDNIVSVETLENVYPNPKQVAVLINENCGSTTEQFLLAAKQSKKVKLFGTTTLGSLDISNMYSVTSPSKEFKLWYGLTKSYRIPDMLIDGKGLQPDYYFDQMIKPYEWIDQTMEILNYK